MRFVGPVLVRSEAGYHVLTLPFRTKLVIGELNEADCREFAEAVRAETPDHDDSGWSATALAKDSALSNLTTAREILSRAKTDPAEEVRKVAVFCEAHACAEKYCAAGQTTNAVAILREAMRVDPTDVWTHNYLAWIEATSPVASIRDGKEAVTAATKACELTHWKEWGCIDTLAAAYAEAGDLKRAVEVQEQALRTGTPDDAARKEMQERLALYERAQPYRSTN